MTYLVVCHEAPSEDAYLLVERNLVHWVWQVGALAIDDVLEVLGKPCIERVQVDFAVNHLEEPVVLVYSQVLDDSLALSSKLLSGGLGCRWATEEVGVDLLERWMTTVDEIAQIIDGRRLVFYEDQDQMQRECGQRLLVACSVNGTDIWDTLNWISF